MSRIGRQPIELPSGVDVVVGQDNVVSVSGPRGSLSQPMHANMRILVEDGTARVERPDDEGFNRGLHGLTRSLLANMVVGVTQGFEKRLAIVGVGYRAALKGKDLELQVVVRGNDKQLVGEIAANIRKIRKPEPYKGKGIRYEGEYVRKKAGKAAKGAVA